MPLNKCVIEKRRVWVFENGTHKIVTEDWCACDVLQEKYEDLLKRHNRLKSDIKFYVVSCLIFFVCVTVIALPYLRH